MRILIILGLLLPTACHWQGEVDKVDAPSLRPPMPHVAVVDIATLSGVLPNETNGRAAGTGLHRATPSTASLSDSKRAGIWLETPLVHAQGPGLVRLAGGGASIKVTLLPSPGRITDQSRLSIAAMRRLGVALDGIVELVVSPDS